MAIVTTKTLREPTGFITRMLAGHPCEPLSDEETAKAAIRVPELNTLFKMFDVEGYVKYGEEGWPAFKVYVRRDGFLTQGFYVPTLVMAELIVQTLLRDFNVQDDH